MRTGLLEQSLNQRSCLLFSRIVPAYRQCKTAGTVKHTGSLTVLQMMDGQANENPANTTKSIHIRVSAF